MPQRPAHYARLSARENLELFAKLEGVRDAPAAAARLLERFSLPGEERPSGELSVGNRQRLNVALSLLAEPRVLLLDEPTASLDPGQRRRVWEVVNALRGEGGAVCFATQNLEELEHADRVLVLAGRAARGVLGRRSIRMSPVALLLRKDLTVLRRSPLLLGALLAYPIVIALLVGLVAGYASSKPRVAWVDEDNVPAVVQVAGHRFHVQTIIDEVSSNVTLVRMSADEAARELASGKVVATITVPSGFVGTLETTARSPSLVLRTGKRRARAARDAAGAGARLPAEPGAAGRVHQGESRLRAACSCTAAPEASSGGSSPCSGSTAPSSCSRRMPPRAARAKAIRDFVARRAHRARADGDRAEGDRASDPAASAEGRTAAAGCCPRRCSRTGSR